MSIKPKQHDRPLLSGADVASTYLGCLIVMKPNAIGQVEPAVMARETLFERMVTAQLSAGRTAKEAVAEALEACELIAGVYNSLSAEEVADQAQLLTLVNGDKA